MDLSDELATYLMVAQERSFSRAAARLELSQGTVSKRILRLEARFRLRLLDRSTRHLTVTPEGTRFIAIAQDILAGIGQAEELRLHDARDISGVIRLLCPSAFAQHLLFAPLLAFAQRYPDIQLAVLTDDEAEHLSGLDADLAIRFGRIKGNSVARRVGTIRRSLIATPDYLARNGHPADIEALGRHRCIVFLNTDGGSSWSFGAERERETILVSGPFASNNAAIIRRLCLASVGICYMPDWLFQKELEIGTAIRIDIGRKTTPLPVFIEYSSRKFLPRRMRVLIDHLAARIRAGV
jgi:LysR family transcriptional regulator, regulator for bpeEF and oprC